MTELLEAQVSVQTELSQSPSILGRYQNIDWDDGLPLTFCGLLFRSIPCGGAGGTCLFKIGAHGRRGILVDWRHDLCE